MKLRKMTAVILVLALALSLSLSALAATGYGPGAEPDVPPFVPTPPVTEEQVVETTTSAIEEALEAGEEEVTVTLANVSIVDASYLQTALALAEEAGLELVVNVDTVVDDVVVARIILDAEVIAQLDGEVDLSVQVDGEAVEAVIEIIEAYFENTVAAVVFGQAGVFGLDEEGFPIYIRVAILVDLSELDTDNLLFYAFDEEEGVFTRINTEFVIDDYDFLHFETPVGGSIIITDTPLTLLDG